MKSKRQEIRKTQAQQNKTATIIAGAGILLLALVIGYSIISSVTAPTATPTPQPTTVTAAETLLGEAIAPSGAGDHIADDIDPGQYNSNPPTSGHHYAKWLDAGFYDKNDYKYPQGHLVHNLEHGYVIFWYNCKTLSESACAEMKTQIKAVMTAAENFKVIAYPWDATDVPVVMTSWGFKLPFKTFDVQLARTFIDQHRNHAPEPNAP